MLREHNPLVLLIITAVFFSTQEDKTLNKVFYDLFLYYFSERNSGPPRLRINLPYTTLPLKASSVLL